MASDREMGELCARVDALEKIVERMDTKVTEVRDSMIRAEGSWRVLAGIAGFSAAVGGLVTAVADWLGFIPRP